MLYLAEDNESSLETNTITRYWKRIYKSWQQPASLASYNDMGGYNFAVAASSFYSAWNVGNFPPNLAINTGNGWISSNTTTPNTVWFAFYNYDKLKVTKISYTVYYIHAPSAYWAKRVDIYGSNDGVNYEFIKTFEDLPQAQGAYVEFDLSEEQPTYKYFRMNEVDHYGYGWSLTNLRISATLEKIIEVTKDDDYDFTTEENASFKGIKLCAIKKKNKHSFKMNVITKYWKNDFIPWTQPVLTANGVLGEDSFAVSSIPNIYSSYYAYYPFNPDGLKNQYTGWVVSGQHGEYIIYNPEPLKITNILVQNRNEPGTPRTIRSGTVLASDDNSSWVELTTFTNDVTTALETWTIDLSSNTNSYKYYKLDCRNSDSYLGIGKLILTALQGGVVPATEDDYDFTTEENVYFAFKKG